MGHIEQPAAPLAVGHSTFLANDNDDAREPRGGFRRGFVLGILTGVVATLLLSPKTGEETREQVKEIGIVLKERAVGMMTGERPYSPS